MVKRCRLMNPYHLWCIAFAATSQWADVRQELLLLLERTFSGWVQSRINEKGNKAIRDAHRDNASKVNSILGPGVDAELSDGVIGWGSVGADGGADGRRRGRASAWVACALWAGGGRDGGHSSRVGAADCGSFGGRSGTVGGGAAPVHGLPSDCGRFCLGSFGARVIRRVSGRLSLREFRRTIGGGRRRGRAGAWATFGFWVGGGR